MKSIVLLMLLVFAWGMNVPAGSGSFTQDDIAKAPYTGPKYSPDPQVILQGGDTIEDATVIPSLPYHDEGTTIGYNDDYDEI